MTRKGSRDQENECHGCNGIRAHMLRQTVPHVILLGAVILIALHLPFYQLSTITLVLVVLGFLTLLMPKVLQEKIRRPLSYIAYPLLFIVLVIPLIDCYFRVPYLFCRHCPRQCPWGMVRHVLVPAALIMNIENFWCGHLCPFGRFQREAAIPRARHLPRRTIVLHTGIVLAAVFVFIMTFTAYQQHFLMDAHGVTIVSSILLIILLSALVLQRPFCNTICPMGLVRRVLRWGQEKRRRKR